MSDPSLPDPSLPAPRPDPRLTDPPAPEYLSAGTSDSGSTHSKLSDESPPHSSPSGPDHTHTRPERVRPANFGPVMETMAPQAVQKIDIPPIDAAIIPPFDLAPDENILFEALLYPNRSLPNAGFIAIMTLLISMNLVIGIVYMVLGAWPVIFFAGLDVALVWLAFKLSYRQGRLHERLVLTDKRLMVLRVLPSGHESRWSLQPCWTRMQILNPDTHEAQVTLTNHGRCLIIGAFLSPSERMGFAKALRAALSGLRTA